MKTGVKNKMPDNEEKFCEHFALYNDAVQAAYYAEYENPQMDGLHLLCRADIRKRIDTIRKTILKSCRVKACIGYEKLALGSSSDAIKLLYCENLTDEEIAKLDLTNVAEIRKLRDGAMEIKFFDRLKALDKLKEFNRESEKKSPSLFDAIKNGANALEEADDYGKD